MCTETYSSSFYLKLLRGNTIKCCYSRLTLKGDEAFWKHTCKTRLLWLSTFGMKLHLARNVPATVCAGTPHFYVVVPNESFSRKPNTGAYTVESGRHFVAQKHITGRLGHAELPAARWYFLYKIKNILRT